MSKQKQTIITTDPWQPLRKYTEARIGLGRCGVSLPIDEYLQFKLAHARARDAVHQRVQTETLINILTTKDITALQCESSTLDRSEYLTRPDKGKVLSKESKAAFKGQPTGFDICLVICDGLSAPAVNETAALVTIGLLEQIRTTTLTCSPVCLVKNGRVAIGDEIGSLLQSKMVITLIGERPGLTSPNSLGAYLTYNPIVGTTDEARNCISNIRKGGMSTADAVRKISYLTEEAFKLSETGVRLKDKMKENYLPFTAIIQQDLLDK